MKILIFLFVAFYLPFVYSASAANPSAVIINEIAWMGAQTSYNDEWIELQNNTDQEINLDGWTLKAVDGAPEIKLARTIPANGFYLLERSKDYTGALENSGEILELYDNSGNLIDRVDASAGWPAGNNQTKQTMERSLAAPGAANWQTSANAGGTPAAENSSPPVQKAADVGFPPVLETLGVNEETPSVDATTTGVVINEILPSPAGPDEEEEWIEIFNQNNFEVNLSDWQITDVIGKTEVYTFPEEAAIKPNGFLIISRPTTKITLNNQGDGLKIIQPDGSIANEVNYENAPRGESYSRFESGWTWTSSLTPGKTNNLPAPTPEPEPPRTESAAINEPLDLAQSEQPPKNTNSLLVYFAAIFTSFSGGAIILILKHVRTFPRKNHKTSEGDSRCQERRGVFKIIKRA